MNPHRSASLILAQRRLEDEESQKERIEEVYTKAPMIKSIDKNIKELGFNIIHKGIAGLDTSVLEAKQAELINLKKEKLRENGFAPDYMEMKYYHEPCKDTGFIGTKMCICRKQLIIDENYAQSNIKGLIERENFDNFNEKLFSGNLMGEYPISPRENIIQIKDELLDYTIDFENQKHNIYIFGKVGRGKTYLLNAIAKDILDQSYSVLYMTSANLFKFLNDYNWAFEDQRQKHEEKYQFILECDLLIIDDLGSEAPTKNDGSNLFEVVNHRMIAEKPIIFSTNYDESMLNQNYGPRVFSRIVGNSKVYEVFGEDLRLRQE